MAKKTYVGALNPPYLESTGTQYINTGITPTANTKVKMAFRLTDGTQGQYAGMMGYQDVDGSGSSNYRLSNAPGNNLQFNGGSSYIIAETTEIFKYYEIECSFLHFIVNNVDYSNATQTWTAATGPIYLFGRYSSQSSGVLTSTLCSARLYYCKIYEGNTLVRDFIPKLNNGTACLYDNVSKTYFNNIGTGNFIYKSKGEVTPITYIQTNGTQFLNTKVAMGYDIQFDADFQYTNITSSVNGWLAATNQTVNSTLYRYYPLQLSAKTKFRCCNTSNNSIFEVTSDTNRHTFTYNGASHAAIYDGTNKGTVPSFPNQSSFTSPITLFAINTGGSEANAGVRLYSCQISNNSTGEVYRDFIPVRNIDGIPCLYDKISKNLFYNMGTGNFIAGAINNAASITPFEHTEPKEVKKMYIGVNDTFTPIAYLEGNDYQYINTKFKPNHNTRVIADLDYDSNQSGAWRGPFGTEGGPRSDSLLWFAERNNDSTPKMNTYYPNPGGSYQQYSFSTFTGRLTWDFNKNIWKIGSTSHTFTSKNFQCNLPLYIFGSSAYASAIPAHVCKMKLYSFKIYDNEALIRDYIPVKDSNGIGCLFDKIENKPYYNQGAGEFALGEETGGEVIINDSTRKISKAYIGEKYNYTILENLKCNGAQYIDTGYKANQNTKVEFTVKFTDTTTTECLYCCRNIDGGGTISNSFTSFKLSSNQWRVDYNTNGTNFNNTIDTSTIYTYLHDKTQYYQNGTLLTTNAESTFQSTNTMILFCSSADTYNHALSNWANYYFYNCKIYDGNKVVRNFIPVKLSDNTVCLLDTVTNVLFYNQGTGAFTAGNAISNVQEVEYIQSSGTQVIDSKVIPNPTTRTTMSLNIVSRSYQDRFFGVHDDVAGTLFYETYVNGSGYIAFAYQNDAGNWISTGKLASTGRTVVIDFDGKNKQYRLTGDVTYTKSLSSYNATNSCINTLYLFGQHSNGNIDPNNAPCKIKLYYCKIYNNGILIRDYVPVLIHNSVYGLYDKVTQQIFYNIGTGNFTGGSTTGTTYTLPSSYQYANAVKQVYDKYEYKTFSSSIIPTSWTGWTSSDNTRFNATNSYGFWAMTGSGNNSTSSNKVPNSHDGSTSSYWYLNSLSSATTEWTWNLNPPVAIKPNTITLNRKYTGATKVTAGARYDYKDIFENDSLGSFASQGSSQATATITVNTTRYYSIFTLTGVRYSSSYTRPYIYEIEIPSGTIRKEK